MKNNYKTSLTAGAFRELACKQQNLHLCLRFNIFQYR